MDVLGRMLQGQLADAVLVRAGVASSCELENWPSAGGENFRPDLTHENQGRIENGLGLEFLFRHREALEGEASYCGLVEVQDLAVCYEKRRLLESEEARRHSVCVPCE